MSKILSHFDLMKFAERFEKARKHRKLGQQALADEYASSFGDAEGKSKYNTIRKWESGKHNPKFGDIVNAAKILDCDLSYLSGDNPDNIYRMDNASAAQTLGLDYLAIEKLEAYPDEIKDFLNKLILNSNGDDLLKLLQAMHTYADGAHHAVLSLQVEGESSFNNMRSTEKLMGAAAMDGRTLPNISKRMLKYNATTTFDEILTNTYNNYIAEGNKRLQERYGKLAEYDKARWLCLQGTDWRKLSGEDSAFLMGESWGDKKPTQEERFAEIDKKYKLLYQVNKEPS